MEIRLVSDLHLEFEDFKLPEMINDAEQVLVIAGDTIPITNGHDVQLTKFVEHHCSRFYKVVMICGNHEYYGTRIDKAHRRLTELTNEYENFHFLNEEHCIIDDILFIGTTLWTNMNNLDTYTAYNAELWMNDYRRIDIKKNGYRKLRVNDTIEMFVKSKDYIFNILKDHGKDRKSVVITHHAPSPRSVSSRFDGDMLNGAYMSDLEYMIEEYEPTYWFHGHMHDSFNYVVGNTNIITNPRGYNGENKFFNGKLVINV